MHNNMNTHVLPLSDLTRPRPHDGYNAGHKRYFHTIGNDDVENVRDDEWLKMPPDILVPYIERWSNLGSIELVIICDDDDDSQ